MADGERLFRLAGEVGVGTCPPKVMERLKKIKEASNEKGNAGEKTGEGGGGGCEDEREGGCGAAGAGGQEAQALGARLSGCLE